MSERPEARLVAGIENAAGRKREDARLRLRDDNDELFDALPIARAMASVCSAARAFAEGRPDKASGWAGMVAALKELDRTDG